MADYAFLMAFACFFAYIFGKGFGKGEALGSTGDMVFLIVVGIPLLTYMSEATIGIEMAWLSIGIAALAGVWGIRNGKSTRKEQS